MPKEAFQAGFSKDPLGSFVKDLFALDACVKCGSCVEVCPVYAQTKQFRDDDGRFLLEPQRAYSGRCMAFQAHCLPTGKTR